MKIREKIYEKFKIRYITFFKKKNQNYGFDFFLRLTTKSVKITKKKLPAKIKKNENSTHSSSISIVGVDPGIDFRMKIRDRRTSPLRLVTSVGRARRRTCKFLAARDVIHWTAAGRRNAPSACALRRLFARGAQPFVGGARAGRRDVCFRREGFVFGWRLRLLWSSAVVGVGFEFFGDGALDGLKSWIDTNYRDMWNLWI